MQYGMPIRSQNEYNKLIETGLKEKDCEKCSVILDFRSILEMRVTDSPRKPGPLLFVVQLRKA